uniref:Uncharacterized protein n=1 Tax=Tanacetum cinerariifolium TaxID=118510 RepID=A0A6L2NM98_TANCI|nr:hypothetical protein [Tanacetum cinerariifolium]
MLDQNFDRLQKLVSQLELLEEKLSQEEVNQKLLRSLSPERNTHVVLWRNKADLDTMSMDDLYNNLKVYEPEVKGMSSSSSSTQNMAFLSSSNNNTSSTSGAVNTAHRVSTTSTQVNDAYSINIDNLSDAVICSFFSGQPNNPQLVREDLEQIHPDDMEEMDLRWQMSMLTMRARRVIRQRKGLIMHSWLSHLQVLTHRYPMILLVQLLKDLKKSELMVLGNFMPLIPDLTFTGLDEFVNKPIVENCKAKSSEEKPKVVRKNDDAPIIEEWVSNYKEEDMSQSKIEKKIVKDKQEKDKIRSKPDKNGKRGEAGKSQKQLQ